VQADADVAFQKVTMLAEVAGNGMVGRCLAGVKEKFQVLGLIHAKWYAVSSLQ
jgi:hypothetical protein